MTRLFVRPELMKASTLFLSLLGLITASIGVLFVVLMWNSYQRAVEQRGWPQVDAVVLSSEVEEWQHDEFSLTEYRLKILYGYEWEGAGKTGDRYSMQGNPNYRNRGKVEGIVEALPVGKTTKLFVNPNNPEITILKPDSKAAGYSIWFPILFVIGGLGIFVRAIINSFAKQSPR